MAAIEVSSQVTMHYLAADVSRLISGVPFMALAKPKPALSFLTKRVETGDELRHLLAEYPHVRCQPLDFHYVCQQSLSALTDELLADLLRHYGWRGIVWGAFIGALSGEQSYLDPILAARAAAPHNQWAIETAAVSLAPMEKLASTPHYELILRLREQLEPLPNLMVRLRQPPSPAGVDRHAFDV